MLGHRGCRLGITYPEIYEMQARAILEAALAVEEQGGAPVQLEIMIRWWRSNPNSTFWRCALPP